jgi:hypothetical protein
MNKKEGYTLICEKFLHNDPDAFHGQELTLHDCVADKIVIKDDILRFYLPDGFWITPHHKESDCRKPVRTGAAVVEFTVKEVKDISVRVFTRKNRWPCPGKTTVAYWPLEELISAVNSCKYTLEFVTQYRTYGEQMWHCVIHSKKRPYYRECQLYLPETEATFFWNDLCPDRE